MSNNVCGPAGGVVSKKVASARLNVRAYTDSPVTSNIFVVLEANPLVGSAPSVT